VSCPPHPGKESSDLCQVDSAKTASHFPGARTGGTVMQLGAPILKDRFLGCLLGLAIGDALGGTFEARTAESIRSQLPTVDALIRYPEEEIWYTDDTQMAIGVAETLVAHGRIIEGPLCAAFVANYVPSRGYGRGARAVLEAMEEGRDYRQV